MPLEICPYADRGCPVTSKDQNYYNGHIYKCTFGSTICTLCMKQLNTSLSHIMAHYSIHGYMQIKKAKDKFKAHAIQATINNLKFIVALSNDSYAMITLAACPTDLSHMQVNCVYIPNGNKLEAGKDIRFMINDDVKLITHCRYEIKSKKIPMGTNIEMSFPDCEFQLP